MHILSEALILKEGVQEVTFYRVVVVVVGGGGGGGGGGRG